MKGIDTMRRICYHSFFEDEQLGEGDGFFERKGKGLVLVAWLDAGDAEFRPEYMTRLFRHFGVDIEPLPDKDREVALRLLHKGRTRLIR